MMAKLELVPWHPKLTARQAEALRLLSATTPTSLGSFAEKLGIAGPAAVTLANRLQRLGYIERVGDRRHRCIVLTVAGHRRATERNAATALAPKTHRQIARILGCSPALVQQIEARGLAKLEKRLKALGFDDESEAAS